MRRLALVCTAVIGLAAGLAACSGSPVQPTTEIAAADQDPSSAKYRPKPISAPSCENLIYPISLCEPSNRPALCAALADAGTFNHPVVGRPATETFSRTTTGSLEVVTIPRPYGLPPAVLQFAISDAQIAGLCSAVG